ncbi:hypothetical protein J2S89_000913 [Arthrobacter bambusae]|nr:hypothetical protein [Arthrobacter bambusae]MDQ0098502.1 hypothetical protein [Arthrobacter bambusae]
MGDPLSASHNHCDARKVMLVFAGIVGPMALRYRKYREALLDPPRPGIPKV